MSTEIFLRPRGLSAAGKTRNRPYLLNGDPVAVQITVNVIFALGG